LGGHPREEEPLASAPVRSIAETEGVTHAAISSSTSADARAIPVGLGVHSGADVDVRRIYWELVPETEVWVRLIPEDPEGRPPLVNLVFHAFYPGRADRDVYSGLPQWPRGAPARLTVSAEPLPLTVIRELSLRLVIDGETFDLTGPNSRYRNLPCLVASSDCTPNAIEAELSPSLLRSVATARSVGGQALGFPITLVAADQLAVSGFLVRAGLAQ
jgi:hypothetical protein